MCRVLARTLVLVLILIVCGQAAGSDIRAVPCTIGSPGQTGECAIILDQVSAGLSEFEIQVLLMDKSVGEITGIQFPSWAGLNSKSGVPSDSVILKAVDTGKRINSGDKEVLLGTLTIRGDSPGTTGIQVKVLGLKDEGGTLYSLPGRNGTLTVLEASTTPLASATPTVPVPSPTPVKTIPTVAVPTSTLPPINSDTTSVPTFVIPTAPLPPVTSPPTTIPTFTPPPPTLPPVSTETTPVPPFVNPTSSPTPIATGTPGGEATPLPTQIPVMDDDTPDADTSRDSPEAVRGALCIDSIPQNARIIVDGRESGITPACITLDGGIHQVSMSTENGYAWSGNISVIAGQTLSLPVLTLQKPLTYVISVSAGPFGTVFPSGNVEVVAGEDAEFYFTPNPGYLLDSVWIDGVSREPSLLVSFASVSENHVLSGTFAPIPAPMAYFSANGTDGYAPFTVGFLDQSRGDITLWQWDFGDGTGSEEPSPVHIYDTTGTYTVILNVCGGGGCDTSRREGLITVSQRDPLVANFSANATSGQVPLMVQFEDLSTGSPVSWLWDFGDGNYSEDRSPAHLYTSEGLFTVRLTVANERDTAVSEKEEMVNVTRTPAAIGGSIGYISVQCNLEGAQIYLDNVFQGTIVNGTLTIPVHVTGTPFNTIRVKDGGFLIYSGPIKAYPSENQTFTLTIPSITTRSVNTTATRFDVPDLLANTTRTLPSLLNQ